MKSDFKLNINAIKVGMDKTYYVQASQSNYLRIYSIDNLVQRFWGRQP